MVVIVGKRKFTKYEQWQVDYIKKHYKEKLTDISEGCGVPPQRVGEIISELGLKRERYWKIYLPKTKEVEEKLRNPYLSHIEIAKEYGVTDTCVARRRKALGVGVRRKNYDTLIEKDVANILDELDLVYENSKRIDKWSIDFYLGRKFCIDVHGTWAHSKPKVIDRDRRKVIFMKENGYKYLTIHEPELENLELVKEKIRQFTLGFPHSQECVKN